jgi:uncharacterized protein YsxB (DUF464 family)
MMLFISFGMFFAVPWLEKVKNSKKLYGASNIFFMKEIKKSKKNKNKLNKLNVNFINFF